uniref:Uncharacterized protein n=1 Tax=Ciona intestinalis TaxID=7719 RepID=H2XSD3_CIOIN
MPPKTRTRFFLPACSTRYISIQCCGVRWDTVSIYNFNQYARDVLQVTGKTLRY